MARIVTAVDTVGGDGIPPTEILQGVLPALAVKYATIMMAFRTG
jgi:hypothetical protein